MTTQQLIAKATERAKREDQAIVVIEYDRGEDRMKSLATERYLDDPEFEAFDGRVLATVYPDGEVEE